MKKLSLISFILNFFLFDESSCINNSFIFPNYNKTILNRFPNYKTNYKKNVILGIIQKYSLNQILPFFKSFIKANFHNCDVVIFVRDVPIIIPNYLKSIGVNVYEISEKYKNISVINLRWKLYLNFLIQNRQKYNFVMHCDVRDTVFQKDIFQYFENYQPFLGVALEDGILAQTVNKRWIVNYAGEEIHKKIKTERIICIGSLWGTIDKFIEFSNYFWYKLIKNQTSIEQGIANYIFYYEKMFNNCLIKSDNYGPVMTIGLSKTENVTVDSQDNILNFKGEIAAVIHQYDRKKNITMKVINKYCPELIYYQTEINNNNKFNENIRYYQIKHLNKKNKNNIYLFILFYVFTIIIVIKSKRNKRKK